MVNFSSCRSFCWSFCRRFVCEKFVSFFWRRGRRLSLNSKLFRGQKEKLTNFANLQTCLRDKLFARINFTNLKLLFILNFLGGKWNSNTKVCVEKIPTKIDWQVLKLFPAEISRFTKFHSFTNFVGREKSSTDSRFSSNFSWTNNFFRTKVSTCDKYFRPTIEWRISILRTNKFQTSDKNFRHANFSAAEETSERFENFRKFTFARNDYQLNFSLCPQTTNKFWKLRKLPNFHTHANFSADNEETLEISHSRKFFSGRQRNFGNFRNFSVDETLLSLKVFRKRLENFRKFPLTNRTLQKLWRAQKFPFARVSSRRIIHPFVGKSSRRRRILTGCLKSLK